MMRTKGCSMIWPANFLCPIVDSNTARVLPVYKTPDYDHSMGDFLLKSRPKIALFFLVWGQIVVNLYKINS